MLGRRNERILSLAGRIVFQCSPQNSGQSAGAHQNADNNKEHHATSRNCHDLTEQSVRELQLLISYYDIYNGIWARCYNYLVLMTE
jgi:hypothetical protein